MVWALTLSEAVRFLRGKVAWRLMEARLLGAVVMLPLASKGEQAELSKALDELAGEGDEALTLAEELGPQVAKDVAELDARNREKLRIWRAR